MSEETQSKQLPIKEETEIVTAVKNCWPWQHRWSKWRNVNAGSDGYNRLYVDQEKRCFACGKMKLRRTTAL